MTSASTTIAETPQRVDLILSQLDQLPTLPAIASRVLQATTSDESSAREVVQLIECDQSLSAKILRLVHQASRGAPRDVTTVDKAVVLLGFNAVRHAVLSLSVFETFGAGDDRESRFDRREFWKHALAVGCLSRLLAERWPGHEDPEVAFVCGLLHDLGKVALDACLPKSYDRVVSLASSRRACILDVEREVLGVDHTVAGKRLAQRWKLPRSLVECIWFHHHTPDMLPDTVVHPDLVQIVNLADTVVREQHIGYSGFLGDSTPSTEIARAMGMPLEHLETVLPKLLDAIQERAELLGLDDVTPGELFTEAVGQASVELGRLSEELAVTNTKLASRTRFLEITHDFNDRLDTHMTVIDICQAGADCARDLMVLPSLALFARQPDQDVCHIAIVDGGRQDAQVCTLKPEVSRHHPWREAVQATGVIVAPRVTAVLRDRLRDHLGPGLPWMLPIVKDGECWGGVLFNATPEEAERLTLSSRELTMFARAVALALSRGYDRQLAERLNEGLVQVNRQLKAAQAELLRRRSLAMIAEMAAGAAHELNNPLAVIAGRSEMMARAATDEKMASGLNIITEQAHRCSAIVNELMAFAKPDPPSPEPIDLGTVLEALCAEVADAHGRAPESFELKISDVPLRVVSDPRQVRGIFEELLANAVHATAPETAKVTINCRQDLTDERVVVTVADNGAGMTPEVLEKSRDPFFSHRAAGRGRGLGLSRAARWCDINGGRMRLESREGEGTTVTIELPVARGD